MPGPLKGPGKFWNIDLIWGYILFILATNCAFWFWLYTFNLTKLFWPPLYYRKLFGSPPSGNSKLFWPPSILPSPPHQSIYERSLNTNKWETENEMHDNTYKDFCQNCALGLQWNMKLKSKVESLKEPKNQTNKQKRHELRNKLMQNGENTKFKIKDGKTGQNE